MDKITCGKKDIKSKLNMYPDVRNAEVTHSIFIHIRYIPLANKDMFNHENMTCYILFSNSSDFIHYIETF